MGTAGTFAFFLGFWLMPEFLPVWPAGILYGPLLVLLFVKRLRGYCWAGPHDRELLALLAGLLTFFIVFSPLQELDATRPDNTSGMALVGLASLFLLLMLRRRVWARSERIDLTRSRA